MPDDSKGLEINNAGPSPEAPKQPDSPKSPEQVRTDQVVEAAREAVATDKPQPVLEDVANGGASASPETPGWVPQPQADEGNAYNPDEDPLVQRANNHPNPASLLDQPMGPDARAAIQSIVDKKKRDEISGLHANIEAVAQQKEEGAVSKSVNEYRDQFDRLYDDPDRDRVVATLAPELQIAFKAYASSKSREESVSELGAPPETPIEQVDNPDDDVDFSALNPVASGTPPPPTPPPPDEGGPPKEPPPNDDSDGEGGDDDKDEKVSPDSAGGTELPENAEERLRRIYESMSPEGRHKRAEAIRKEISRMETRMDKVASLDDMETIQKRIEAAQNHLDLIEETQQDKDDPKFVGKNKGEIDTSGDEAARKLDETIDEYRRFGESSFDELKKTETKEQNALKGLREQMSRAKTKDERNLIASRIADAEARLAVIKSFKTEKETGHLEEKNAEAIREAELRRRELGKTGELEASITVTKGKLEIFDKDILAIEAKILKEQEGSSEWKRLNNEKLELSKRANRSRESLRLDEDALKAAEEKRRQESGTGDTPTLENIERKSVGEYLSLSPQERKNYLRSVSEALPNDGRYNFADINGRAAGGEALSIEEKAYLSNEITRRLLTKSGYEASCLPLLAAQHPEVFGLVSDKIMASKAAEAFRRENFATGWEKMLDFAKKNPQLLALLMLLIVGAVAGPTTTVIGAGKFMMR